MPQPSIPIQVNKLIQNNNGELSTFPFPPNFAATIPKEMRREILRWMLTNYIWPQITSRQPFEEKWNKLLDMARASWKIQNLNIDEKSMLERKYQQQLLEGNAPMGQKIDVSETIIFDAIDRLNNLNHYVSFKEELPMQFNLPENRIYPNENAFYSPSGDLVTSANGLLKFCAKGANYYRNHWIAGRHHYVYGVSYANSEYVQQIEMVQRRVDKKNIQEVPELTKFGVSFEPLSIRKLWLRTEITPYNMDYQPCPFFFEEIPRFAIIANQYHPELNPFGYVNLDKLPPGQWLYTAPEMNSFMDALKQINPDYPFPTAANPKNNIESKWVLYPMLPLAQTQLTQETLDKLNKDEPEIAQYYQQTGKEWVFDSEQKLNIPLTRYVIEMFGISLTGGECEIIRLQPNFYPKNRLPIFGSAHMPDLDSGQYSPCIGDILEGHYIQLCKALNQFLVNKDRINNPPKKMQFNSPSADRDTNIPGAHNPVNTMNDYANDEIIDGTQTTPAFMALLREQAQTSSKAVDAIRGQAMGSRTTASEANSVIEIAMSGISTDINLFNHDMGGNYAERVWDYMTLWPDPDVIAAITGQYGFQIKPEHYSLQLDIKWDSGSTYVESLLRQGNYRYILEAGRNDPSINRPYLWRELLKEWGVPNVDKIINDGGLEEQILEASQQAQLTYMGEMILVDPDQDHQIAKRVKTAYLKDRDSVWNTKPEFAQNAQALIKQIQIHELFIQIQMQQQMAMMEAQNGLQPLQTGGSGGGGAPNPSPSATATDTGMLAQQNQAA